MGTLTGREDRVLDAGVAAPRALEPGSGMLRGDVRAIKEVALQPEAKVTPTGATVDGVFWALEPYEPEVAVVWAVKVALAQALGGQDAAGLEKALQSLDEEKADFLEGAVAGVGRGAHHVVKGYLEGALKLLEGIVSYYSLSTDPEIWVRMWEVWSAKDTSEAALRDMAAYLKSDYPGLWAAVIAFPELWKSTEKFFADLEEEGAVAKLVARVRDALLGMLRELGQKKVRQFVALTGDAYEQGAMVGEAAAITVITAVLVAMDVRSLARSLVKMGHQMMEVPELAGALRGIASKHGELGRGARALKLIEEEAVRLYEELAREIAPYRKLKKRTGEFNRHVAAHTAFSGRSALGAEVEYVGLRLDADHILEDRIWAAYPDECKKMGWASAEEMPSIALHTEYHIRSGDGLTDVFQIQDTGVTGKTSLTDAKLKTFPDAAVIRQKYPTLRSLLEGYEDFYRGQRVLVDGHTIEGLWPRLESWFATQKARAAALNL
ncbi:MAG: hypothetical protein ABW277_16835 [Longimicrobiaceae bacterium]